MNITSKNNTPLTGGGHSKNQNSKIIVWALYDDAYSSYKKAIKKHYDGIFEEELMI